VTPDDLVLTRSRRPVFKGGCTPCTIGRTGVTTPNKRGDKARPAAFTAFPGCYTGPTVSPPPVPWARAHRAAANLWSDDVNTPAFTTSPSTNPLPHSHEHCAGADALMTGDSDRLDWPMPCRGVDLRSYPPTAAPGFTPPKAASLFRAATTIIIADTADPPIAV